MLIFAKLKEPPNLPQKRSRMSSRKSSNKSISTKNNPTSKSLKFGTISSTQPSPRTPNPPTWSAARFS